MWRLQRRWFSEAAQRLQKGSVVGSNGKSVLDVPAKRPSTEVKKNFEPRNAERVDYISRILAVDSVRKTTAGGRVNRFRAIVCAGNGFGAAGFALGKADSVRKAVAKAYALSKKRWVAIELTPEKGLYHDVMGRFNDTKVMMRACKPYKGLMAGRIVRGICECFGIENATTRAIGSKSTLGQVYGTFHALSQLKTPREESIRLGRKIVRTSRWV